MASWNGRMTASARRTNEIVRRIPADLAKIRPVDFEIIGLANC